MTFQEVESREDRAEAPRPEPFASRLAERGHFLPGHHDAVPAAQEAEAEQGAQVAIIVYDQDLRHVAGSYG